MWPFNRRKKASQKNVPKEVEEYYQSERRERVGIAWLLALGTLIATVVIAIGLFYGGRWAWRHTFGNDNKTASTQGNQPESQPASDNTPEGEGTDQPPATDTTPSTPTPAPSPSPTTPATPAKGSQHLTNTGPGDSLAIFLAVSVLSFCAHEIYVRRKLSATQ